MSLDTSTYSLALLRVDGRRWNELRRLNGQIRTQHASDGSSYLEMGHTKVMCVVTGPHEAPRKGGASQSSNAVVNVNIVVAGFSSVDRRRRGRNDNLPPHPPLPHSTISISLHVLSQDGSLLAALINASTLALVDAGIPMTDYIAACTSGSTSTYAAADEAADPLLDLNLQEEQELPFLTVATLGASDKVVVLVCESRVRQVRQFMDQVVKEKGSAMAAQ
ncbi:unnamed protein product [Parascedosporium putredinis]|uniref:Exoribonuclease phosphorolytic domain-containing protein n=1 Tax=Parascedosporium putredinis TaxID=1442378 RepID=A0A9P1MD23_9PEZI|nr:unnamed protein product [Parascedosporium putredinis]CAI8001798.1 unnamed protein product [Parascedosporium putredinis]